MLVENSKQLMAQLTQTVGWILTLMGVAGYFGSGMASVTALIPAFFGLPLVLLGRLARDESKRKHVMHAAVLLGLLGFAGSVPGLLKLPSLFTGGAERPMAVAMQSAMALLLAFFVVSCVRSFIAARRARDA